MAKSATNRFKGSRLEIAKNTPKLQLRIWFERKIDGNFSLEFSLRERLTEPSV